MPYSVSNPPDKIKKLSPKKQRQWIHVFNQALESGDDEGTAHAKAWGVVKKASYGQTFGPTESEGSLADATLFKDLLAVEELNQISRDIGRHSILMAAAIKKQAMAIQKVFIE